MESWKLAKKRQQKRREAQKPWKIYLLAAVLVITTFAAGIFNFPNQWNQFVSSNNLSFLEIEEVNFRLGLDLQGGAHLIYQADMSQIEHTERAESLDGVRNVVERRVNAFGVSEPRVQTTIKGDVYRIIVELAGITDVSEAIREIGETPILEFKEPNTEIDVDITEEGLIELEGINTNEREVAGEILSLALSGEDFTNLVDEFGGSGEITITTDHTLFGGVAEQLQSSGFAPGIVFPTIIENVSPSGTSLNIVNYLDRVNSKRVDVSHLLVCFEGKVACVNPITQIEATILMNSIKEQATAENFAELAREHSTDPTAAQNDGHIGFASPGDLVPAFELAALSVPVGGVSDIVETEFGYHLILKHAEEPVDSYKVNFISVPYSQIEDIVTGNQWKNTDLSGKQLKRAEVSFEQNSGVPNVLLTFDKEGDELFGKLTEAHIGEPIAIFLDGSPISIPTVQQAIYGGQAVITGNFTIDEAKLLAQRLNAGALPVPIELLSQQTVGPTLGQTSLEKSITAGLAGLALVAVFMIIMYRLPGILAVFALVLYCMLNLAAYKIFGVTISLAGIAGFVLSLGIAVDANVLIFERLKDEIRGGRDLIGAIDEGFKRAWAPIRDGNITTLIAAGVLYGFSASFIKGFALTLSIGVILSLFTAIVVTRAYLKVVQKVPALRKVNYFAWAKKAPSVEEEL